MTAPAAAAAMVQAAGLAKRYGDKRVLSKLAFSLQTGGFLLVTGPNGAGKSTLLRLCARLESPTAGTLEVAVERAELGYLGHEPLLYRELTALENLELFAKLYRVPQRRERCRELLERFGMWGERDNRISTYSRGMTQRVALCRVLLHEPRLLILDEPYTALDTQGAELLDAVLAERRGNHTFLVSTHDPARIEQLASDRLELAGGGPR